MKTGSRRFRLSPLVLLAVMLVGCIADEVGGIYIVSSPTEELYAVANHSTSAFFLAGGKWTASPSVDWLEVTPSNGDGGRNDIVIKTTKPNLTMQERTGSVVITSDGKSQEIFVKQRSEYASFDQKEYVVDSAGGVVIMPFVSNIEKGKLMVFYYIHDWIVIPDQKNGTRGDIWNGTLKPITVLPNPTPEERSTVFVLGFYNDKKRFLGLDSAWIRQKPSSGLVEIPDSVNP